MDDPGILADIDDPRPAVPECANEERILWIALALVIVIGIGGAAISTPISFARRSSVRSNAAWAGASTVGEVYFSLFTWPGFTLENVTIHEDPRAGIEPFAYVGELEARVRLLAVCFAPSGIFDAAAERGQAR